MPDANSRDLCDYCGQPIGFYGCPRHGTDCYDEALHPEWFAPRPGDADA